MFHDRLYDFSGTDFAFREDGWRKPPSIVEVRLRDGRRLDEVGGRRVYLVLHTLNWAGDLVNCPTGCGGDIVMLSVSDEASIGLCEDAQAVDWHIDGPPLADECPASNLPQRVQQEATIESAGVKVVNELNADLPSMRAGHARFAAQRNLADSLANEARWMPFGILYPDNPEDGLLFLNAPGVSVELDDLPGWRTSFFQAGPNIVYLRVTDTCANKHYDYLVPDRTWDTDSIVTAEDYAFNTAYLRRVVNGLTAENQRVYVYEQPGVGGRLIAQSGEGGTNRINYTYTPGEGADLKLTVNGEGLSGTRTIDCLFDLPAGLESQGSGKLVGATLGGTGSEMLYEWDNKGKLTKVTDGQQRVLAEFEYDAAGRILKKTRGTGQAEQLLAEYDWGSLSMVAKFYTDSIENEYEVIRRELEGEQVVKIEQWSELNGLGEKFTTEIDNHTPDSDDVPNCGDPDFNTFYHRCCGGVPISRCTETKLPDIEGGSASEYVFYPDDVNEHCDFFGFPVDTFLALPGIAAIPTDAVNHIQQKWKVVGDEPGIVQQEYRKDVPRNAQTDFLYYETTTLRLKERLEPQISVGLTGYLHTGGNRPKVTFEYDDYGRMKKETRWRVGEVSPDQVIDFAYNSYGDLFQRIVSGPGGTSIATTFVYNEFGQETARIDDATGVTEGKEYEPGSGLLLSTHVFANGGSGPVLKQTKYEYEQGRVKKVKVANDDDGAFPLNAPDAWIETTFEYDDYGRMTSKSTPFSGGVAITRYEYDRQDRITKITFEPEGIWKEYHRDGRGAITQTVIGSDATTDTLQCTYQYDARGNLTRRVCQGCPDCANETTYEYDRYNRLEEVTRVGGGQ